MRGLAVVVISKTGPFVYFVRVTLVALYCPPKNAFDEQLVVVISNGAICLFCSSDTGYSKLSARK